MTLLRAAAILLAAAVVQITVQALLPGGRPVVDPFFLAVFFVATRWSRTPTLLFGAAAGLLQDGIFSGLLGFHLFSKTLLAYLAGLLGEGLVLTAFVARMLFLGLGTLLDYGIIAGLRLLITQRAILLDWRTLLLEMALNVFLGHLLIVVTSRPASTEARSWKR